MIAELFSLDGAGAPNGWAALIALFQVMGTAFAVWVAYRKTRDGQDPKLDQIQHLVNGDRAAKEEKIRVLEARLREREDQIDDAL